MKFQLKPATEIKALVTGKEHDKVEHGRRMFLAEKATSAATELHQVLPVMISHAATPEEAAFIRSLATEVPAPETKAPAPKDGEEAENAHE